MFTPAGNSGISVKICTAKYLILYYSLSEYKRKVGLWRRCQGLPSQVNRTLLNWVLYTLRYGYTSSDVHCQREQLLHPRQTSWFEHRHFAAAGN
jgi:hypothetical protein